MRRIIQNTTAIAACLSLLAPHAAMAQTAAPEDEAQVEAPAEAPAEAEADAPVEAEAAADAAADAVVLPEEATCADGATPPCAEAEAAPAVEAEAEAEAVEADAAAGEVAAEVTEEVAAEPAVEAEAIPAEEPQDAAVAEPVAEPAAEEPAAAEAGAETAPAVAPAEAEAQPATEAPTEAEAEAAAAETAPAEATADVTPADAATDAEALEKALAKQAAEAEAQAEAQPEPADATATPAPAPVETEAAKEAAAVAVAPTAAALSDEAGEAEVTEEQVTDENTRSSDEDFATALRDALENQGEPQQAEASNSDDDDDNDLTKAMLLGLGGIAVGAMLNNNRQVALSSPDRVVVTRADGSQQIIKDEVALLRQPGSTVTTENFADGSSRTTVTRSDGSKVVTIRDADLRVLRRTLIAADGVTTQLIDDTSAQPVDITTLPAAVPGREIAASQLGEDDLRAALLRESAADRRFSLAQIRDIPQVRSLVAPVNIDAITFDTGSAAIDPDQAQKLSTLGNVIRDTIAQNPGEVFLIEAHTDTVGSDAANLALSDRRAESVALALSEYFDVPPENMVVQGYGEQQLKVLQEGDVRENRRAAVRRITDLLQQASN